MKGVPARDIEGTVSYLLRELDPLKLPRKEKEEGRYREGRIEKEERMKGNDER